MIHRPPDAGGNIGGASHAAYSVRRVNLHHTG
jgi:hypothetical protein